MLGLRALILSVVLVLFSVAQVHAAYVACYDPPQYELPPSALVLGSVEATDLVHHIGAPPSVKMDGAIVLLSYGASAVIHIIWILRGRYCPDIVDYTASTIIKWYYERWGLEI